MEMNSNPNVQPIATSPPIPRAAFYAIVGIAMGRMSDFVPRKKMLAVGLALWSIMTALGGLAVGFVTLSAALITLWIAARRLPFETPERRLALAQEAGEN